MDENFWEQLLTLIERRKVIPVVGERAVTKGPGDFVLYDWLALRVAESFGINREALSEAPSLNQVVTACLSRGGVPAVSTVYTQVSRILNESLPPPGSTLQRLAGIPAFNLFISTTFDRLLEKALDDARFGGAQRTQSFAYWPGALEDLPARKRDLSCPTVYHLLGRAAALPEFALREEDTLECVCRLNADLPNLEKLARDLNDHALLILGLNFSDWLVRFFLRIAKQGRLSERPGTAPEYLAEGPQEELPQSMVLFFGGMPEKVRMIPSTATAFTAELVERWHSRHPDSFKAQEAFVPPPSAEMPDGAVFLSYAREDETAVIRLKIALEQAGFLVWYDRERLKAGQYWPDELEEAVSKRCGLFVSVISKTTETAVEGYFHRERAWAENRASGFAPGEEFYLPLIIDDSPFEFKREPRVAKTAQGSRAPGGVPPDSFLQHLRAIQQRRGKPAR